MKSMVVYYSRSGVTRKVAEKVSEGMGAELVEITEKGKRKGPFGFLKSGMEAYTERLVTIDQPKQDASQYDLVVIGTPVWAGKMSSPVRSYIAGNRDKLKSVAFFITLGGENFERALAGLAEYSGKEPLSTLIVRAPDVEKGDYAAKMEEFLTKLR